jgi:hypothetical protein
MSTASDQYAGARKDALARMQSRWGRERKNTEKTSRESNEPVALPFLELSDEDLDLALRLPTPSHLSGLKDALRELRAERFAELEEPAVRDPEEQGPSSKRRELFAEIASEHFRQGMGSWLTSIAPDHGLSATPVEELEKIREEMLYRLKLVKAIAAMMQREADALETQIKARRILNAPEENS